VLPNFFKQGFGARICHFAAKICHFHCFCIASVSRFCIPRSCVAHCNDANVCTLNVNRSKLINVNAVADFLSTTFPRKYSFCDVKKDDSLQLAAQGKSR